MPDIQTSSIDVISTVKGLRNIKNDMQALFSDVFKRNMGDQEWEHYYLSCPYGNATVFVCYVDNKLVAHGGLIPQRLLTEDGCSIKYYLQTAIMVHKDFQTLILFNELMQTMQDFIIKQNVFSVAFPNNNTFLPFTRMLGWSMACEYSIVQYVVDEQATYKKNQGRMDKIGYSFFIDNNNTFIQWRGESNNMQCYKNNGCTIYYKHFDEACEILDIQGDGVRLIDIVKEMGLNKINVPECYSTRGSFEGLRKVGSVGIPQRMCFYPGEHPSIDYTTIQPSLLISDVF